MTEKWKALSAVGIVILIIASSTLYMSDYRNILALFPDTDIFLVEYSQTDNKLEIVTRSHNPDIEFSRKKYEDDYIKLYFGSDLRSKSYWRVFEGSTQKNRIGNSFVGNYELTDKDGHITQSVGYFVGNLSVQTDIFPDTDKQTIVWNPEDNSKRYNLRWIHETDCELEAGVDLDEKYPDGKFYLCDGLVIDMSHALEYMSQAYMWKNGRIQITFKSEYGKQEIDPKIGTFTKEDYLKWINREVGYDHACSYYVSNYLYLSELTIFSDYVSAEKWINDEYLKSEGYWEAKESYEVDIPVYGIKEACRYEDITDNVTEKITTVKLCYNESVVIGTEKETRHRWVDFKWNTKSMYLRFCADLKKPELGIPRNIEHIPVMFGYEFTEYDWWNSTYKYRYQINSNATNTITININDTYAPNIWVINGTAYYLICEVSGCATGSMVITDENNEQVQWENGTSRTGNDTTSVWNTMDETVVMHFDENTGTTSYDSGVFGNDGTLTNSPTYVDGVFAYGIQFDDGDTDYIAAGDTGLPRGDMSRTVITWAYFTEAGVAEDYIVFHGTYSNNDMFGFSRATNNRIAVYGYAHDQESTIAHNLNEWVMIGVVYDSLTNNLTFWINDTMESFGTFDYTTALDGDFEIAIDGQKNPIRDLNATLDEVRIYNRSLTHSEMRDIFNNGVNRRSSLGAEEEFSVPAPVITITNPENTAYGTGTIDLNVDSDIAVDTWYFELDNNGTNETFTPNITISVSEGSHNIIVYGNNSNVWGSDSVSFSICSSINIYFNGTSGDSYFEHGSYANITVAGTDVCNYCIDINRTGDTNIACGDSGVEYQFYTGSETDIFNGTLTSLNMTNTSTIDLGDNREFNDVTFSITGYNGSCPYYKYIKQNSDSTFNNLFKGSIGGNGSFEIDNNGTYMFLQNEYYSSTPINLSFYDTSFSYLFSSVLDGSAGEGYSVCFNGSDILQLDLYSTDVRIYHINGSLRTTTTYASEAFTALFCQKIGNEIYVKDSAGDIFVLFDNLTYTGNVIDLNRTGTFLVKNDYLYLLHSTFFDEYSARMSIDIFSLDDYEPTYVENIVLADYYVAVFWGMDIFSSEFLYAYPNPSTLGDGAIAKRNRYGEECYTENVTFDMNNGEKTYLTGMIIGSTGYINKTSNGEVLQNITYSSPGSRSLTFEIPTGYTITRANISFTAFNSSSEHQNYYDYEGITVSSPGWYARYESGSVIAITKAAYFTNEEYVNISLSDDISVTDSRTLRLSIYGGPVDVWIIDEFNIPIDELESDVTEINITWEGTCYSTAAGGTCYRQIWNFNSSSWYTLGTHSAHSTDKQYSDGVDGGTDTYIGDSGYIRYRVRFFQTTSTDSTMYISTDYYNMSTTSALTYPANLSIDTDGDGNGDWNYTNTINSTDNKIVADLNITILEEAVNDSSDDLPSITVYIRNEGYGILQVDEIDIRYTISDINVSNPKRYLDIDSTVHGNLEISNLNNSFDGDIQYNVSANSSSNQLFVRWSNISSILPYTWTDDIMFHFISANSSNRTPFFQSTTIPILNVTNRRDYDVNVGIAINESLDTCWNIELSNTSTGLRHNISTTYQLLSLNLTGGSDFGIWMWAFSDDCSSGIKLFYPEVQAYCSLCKPTF